MKKRLIDVTKRRKKTAMVTIAYVLLVALLSVGIIGCSKEETTSAKTSVSADAKKSSAKETEEDKVEENADDTHGEDKVEKKETTKATASETSKNETTSSSTKKSSSSNASTTTKTKTSTKNETHTHSWEAVYKEVDKGYWKQELVKAAWTEEIPQYTMVYRSFCNGCGADITGATKEHMEPAMLAGNYACGGYTIKQVKTQNGTKTVEHPAEYKDVWVSNIVKEVDYYKCSCGATK